MAQKFGGKYSPGAAPDPTPGFRGQRPTKAGFRSNLLFVLPFLFVWKAFQGEPGALILGLGAFGLLLAGAWATREGLLAQEAYEARKVARRPAIPRKIFGAVLAGLGLGLASAMAGQGVVISALLGAIGGGLNLAAFGLDPLSDKGAEGVDQFQTDRVARAVAEAEAHLTAMRDVILRARDRNLETRVDRFASTARTLFRTIENDPGDLTAARKYLSVYLQGARDATVKFADLYAQSREAGTRADYETLLSDLETNFASRTTALLSNDKTDLDVEISVLRDRLKLEG